MVKQKYIMEEKGNVIAYGYKQSILIISIILFVFILFGKQSLAQRIVKVAPGYATLNTAIENDKERDENTIYELERGGFYITSGTIENVGYTLRVWAEVGEGERPVIKPGVDQGGLSVASFGPRGDFYAKGLKIINVDILGQFGLNSIVCKSDSLKIVLEDCHFDSTFQAYLRFDGDWMKVYISDCIFSNSLGDYHNARGFDDRKNNVDSVVVRNSTFYNIAAQVVREGGGGATNYYEFDHCTFYNIGRKFGNFGQSADINFTNNLIINTSILGRDSTGTFFAPLQFEKDFTFASDPLTTLHHVGITQKINFSNNIFFRDDGYIDYNFPNGVEFPVPLFENAFRTLYETYEDYSTLWDDAISFTNPPIVDVDFVDRLWKDSDSNQDGRLGDQINGEFSNQGAPFNFSYSSNHFAYTGGTDGLPLGDLNWFESRPTGVDEDESLLPLKLTVHQNFPNPFNPSTTISYSIPRKSIISLSVFDMAGRQIKSLENTELKEAGKYQVNWKGKNSKNISVSSGIYIARLSDGRISKNIKMLLIK
ncbi:MAG: T9SS type A sorting domain-containing protein [Candidatus Cloacimonetes bacterium]|nr:T9SS type A sorting domain-containing protein [Candidatus Cloacimonadota bacterium]